MIVSFSIGSRSKAVTNTLKKSADNIDFYSYDTVQLMIKEASLRHISFDRIIFSTAILKDIEGDLRELNDFIRNQSDSTEVVMIVTPKDSSSDKLFCSIFNSPMYTPVIMEKATPQSLLQIVQDDIIELRTKFYVLDVKKDTALTSSSEVKVEEKPVQTASIKKEKKGFFSGLMGKNKKNVETVQNENLPKEEEKELSNGGEIATEKTDDFMVGPRSVFTGFGGEIATNTMVGAINETMKTPSPVNVSTPFGVPDLPSNNSVTDDEDELLAIGEYGSQHSDTGFLDEDDEEELRKFAEAKEQAKVVEHEEPIEEPEIPEPEPIEEVEEVVAKSARVESSQRPTGSARDSREQIVQRNREVVKPQRKLPNIDLVVGVKGSSVTQSIVDEAVRLVTEEGIKVLIMDLDNYEHGLLSFIDTEKYYLHGAEFGIARHRVYEEDGVGIASNGYGISISSREVFRFLTGKIPMQYDMVFIDCPTSCLDLLSVDILKLCTSILVMSGNDRSDLIATSLALTDRSVVDLEVERYIMNICNVEIAKGKHCEEEDIAYLKRVCLFANGNWLLNIE